MPEILKFGRLTVLLILILLVLATLLGIQALANKRKMVTNQSDLQMCEKNLFELESEVSSCLSASPRQYEQYGECTREFCLFTNETTVQGYLTFTGDMYTEKTDFMGDTVECTYVVVKDAPITPMFLLQEKFGNELRFTFNEDVPVALKNKKNVKLTTTFPFAPAFGPLPCVAPFLSIISN